MIVLLVGYHGICDMPKFLPPSGAVFLENLLRGPSGDIITRCE
jgi:hypothetical protein